MPTKKKEMPAEENLIDIIKALVKHSTPEKSNEFLDILATISTLMLEVSSNRFNGASYYREFKIDRLQLKIQFNKGYPHA